MYSLRTVQKVLEKMCARMPALTNTLSVQNEHLTIIILLNTFHELLVIFILS